MCADLAALARAPPWGAALLRAHMRRAPAACSKSAADNAGAGLYEIRHLQSWARIGRVQDKVSSDGKLHHEDLEIGKPYDCGSKTVTKDEIIGFGSAWDPQPLHVDEEAAKLTLVGGL
ncbi:MAG: hypothetical protein E6G91_06665 [Alphaproteobacteria bacterium]|nr:MAG: hypothetical protein E6G91_06665 [Alphaproteobacteria bacterium]